MRRYDIVAGILLILSIIEFALAAPALVQEKRQARTDVVDIPKDVVTVLGERGEPEDAAFERLFKYILHQQHEAAGVESESSSSGSDHESTNVVQPPAPSTA